MSLNNPVLSEGYVPAYQMSAVPFVTASNLAAGATFEISFPQVSRFFTIKNTSQYDDLRVSFTQNGLSSPNNNYFSLVKSSSFREEIRTTKLFLFNNSANTMTFEVVAGLTSIPSNHFLTITGSNGHSGVG